MFRGIELSAEDRLRRSVITELICHFRLDVRAIEGQYGIRFAEHFEQELEDLAEMQTDGLLEMTETHIRVLPAGRLLIRNICMVFDAYLRRSDGQRFSKVI